MFNVPAFIDYANICWIWTLSHFEQNLMVPTGIELEIVNKKSIELENLSSLSVEYLVDLLVVVEVVVKKRWLPSIL